MRYERRRTAPHPSARSARLFSLPASGERVASGIAASRVRGKLYGESYDAAAAGVRSAASAAEAPAILPNTAPDISPVPPG